MRVRVPARRLVVTGGRGESSSFIDGMGTERVMRLRVEVLRRAGDGDDERAVSLTTGSAAAAAECDVREVRRFTQRRGEAW